MTPTATLVLLAGGRSARMGRDKATLPLPDGTLLERIVRVIGPAFREVIVCGAAAPAGARAVADRRADSGPLAGIEAGLSEARTAEAFVLACDMPRVSARLASLLLERSRGHDVALPRVGDRDQPLCAAYTRTTLPKLSSYLGAGGRRVATFVASLDAVRVGEDELTRAGIALEELSDIDTPADYEAFLTSLRP